jgi:glutamate synthase domain-containing protein 2
MTIVRNVYILLSIVLPVLTILLALMWPPAWWAFVILAPLLVLGSYDLLQRKHTVLRLYPIIGHVRYMFEYVRPEIQQYFVEDNLNGRPINREFRSLVYQRAKGVRDTRPFGTQFDVYRSGYEWVNHSMSPSPRVEEPIRILFGGRDCTKPYSASVLNISAMSFGALSKHAILALNQGAKIGGFAHNTGEGGVSPYHLQHGGDLIWQIGTGYFGCRNDKGQFDEALFSEQAAADSIRMIEIKLSQGAKPGHGGILPAAKLTEEIAAIRKVPMGADVLSPATHSAFSSPVELLQFIARLRELSGGKPVGFKLCVGHHHEFLAICKAMIDTGIKPDFITVDGGEGGTGAAPIELANSVGTPLRDGLNFVHNALIGCNLRQDIRIIASGKILSAFHMFRHMALGADTINSARAMMLALGCIQSLHCNTDRCPTGIATQNPARYQALNVEHKSQRVARYHKAMVHHLSELVSSAGLASVTDIERRHVNRRIDGATITNYEELYPSLEAGSLLVADSIPDSWKRHWQLATPGHWYET